jgi:hypothetical protein
MKIKCYCGHTDYCDCGPNSMTIPDKWVVIRIIQPDGQSVDKVFASWYGGYLDNDYWRLNSGIDRTEEDQDYYYFYGYSGSCYKCRKGNEGIAGLHNKGIFNTIIDNIEETGVKVEQIIYDI